MNAVATPLPETGDGVTLAELRTQFVHVVECIDRVAPVLQKHAASIDVYRLEKQCRAMRDLLQPPI